jgi:hypothetical protein
MLSVLREVLAARFKHIILFALFLLALVFAGRFVVLRDPTNLLLLVLPLSTIPIILLHKGTTAFLVRYYVGMLVLAYAILLLLGLFSVSTYFLGGAARWFDVIIALFLMGLVRLSERVFGVGISFVLDLVSSQKNPK